jgi:hypothetical protein
MERPVVGTSTIYVFLRNHGGVWRLTIVTLFRLLLAVSVVPQHSVDIYDICHHSISFTLYSNFSATPIGASGTASYR